MKLKNGAEVVPLRREARDNVQGQFMGDASAIVGQFKPGEMGGFVVVAWDHAGLWTIGYRFDEDCVVGATLAPSFVADALRRQLIRNGVWTD